MTEPVIVTGIQTGYNPGDPEYTRPVRLEWTDFEQDIDLVTIYVKALVAFQALPQDANHPTSYFQVAGILSTIFTNCEESMDCPIQCGIRLPESPITLLGKDTAIMEVIPILNVVDE